MAAIILSGTPADVEFDDLQDFLGDVRLVESTLTAIGTGCWRVLVEDPAQMTMALGRSGEQLATAVVTITVAPVLEGSVFAPESLPNDATSSDDDDGAEGEGSEGTKEAPDARPLDVEAEGTNSPVSPRPETGDDGAALDPSAAHGDPKAHQSDAGLGQSAKKEKKDKKSKKKDKKDKKEKKEKKERRERREPPPDEGVDAKRRRLEEMEAGARDEQPSAEMDDDHQEAGDEQMADADNFPDVDPEAEPTTPARTKKELRLSGKYSADTTPGELLKGVPKTPTSITAPPTPLRKPVSLEDLAEIKARLLTAKRESQWDDVRAVLKGLLVLEPRMEDLQVTKLGHLVKELKQVPHMEVYADIVLRSWMVLAARHGIRPRASTSSGFMPSSPLSSPITLQRPAVSPTSVPSSLPSPLSLPVPPLTHFPSFAEGSQFEGAPADPAAPSIVNPDEPTSPASLVDTSHQELWGRYPDTDFNIHTSSVRNVMIRRLYHALLTRDEEEAAEYVRPGSLDPKDVAISIEEAIHSMFSGSEKTRLKFSQICTNMTNRSNGNLRWSVLSGEVTASSLAQMKSEDMGHEEARARRQQSKDFARDAARAEWGEKRVTDTFRCSKCGQRKTTYFQMQTRSADEPMTTFVTCTVCSHAWKF